MSLDVQPQSLRDLAAYSITRTSTPSLDERPTLPSIGFEISRPPSTSSQASSYYPTRRPSPNPNLQLPALRQLSTLASVATSSLPDSPHSNGIGSSIVNLPGMNFSPTPAATVGPGGQAPICANCGTTYTPLWRRDENGIVLCNACGLFLKLHGRSRPISLKTDVIKSRNRVKTNQAGRKRTAGEASASLPAVHPEAAAAAAVEAARRASASNQLHSGNLERSQSPISQAGTPGVQTNSHSSNIAPQSMFDSVTLDNTQFFSPALSQNPFRAPSPATSSTAGHSTNHLQPPHTIETVKALQTRVRELEVINGLINGHFHELESNLEESRGKEELAKDLQRKIQTELDLSLAREAELKRKVEDLETELIDIRDGPRSKKMRLSDLVEDGSQASTPMSSAS